MAPSSSSSAELQSLLKLAADGDERAADELIAVAQQRLFRLTRRMLRNYPHLRRWEQTDDVFQNAVMRLHRSLSKVRPDSPARFFGLASTQIRRTLIDLARHHFGPEGQAAKHETKGGTASNDGGDPVQGKPDIHEEPETLDSWARFHEAVESMPGDERDVFQLVWYGGLPQKDVAAILGISLPTMQRRWYRSRHFISDALSGEPPLDEG